MDPAATGSEPTSLTSAPINSIRLQTNDGILLSADSAGVVRTWDILTGLCKASFHTPAEELTHGAIQLVKNKLILVWFSDEHIYILDTEEGASPLAVDAPWESWCISPIISGDGSKVFFLADNFIQAWSIETGELVGEVELEGSGGVEDYYSHIGDGSRIWVNLRNSPTKGRDFGISDPTPIPLPDMTPDGPHLELNRQGNANKYRIRDKDTGTKVFQLSGKYTNPTDIDWDGQYLAAGYESGEVLILDFNHILPQ